MPADTGPNTGADSAASDNRDDPIAEGGNGRSPNPPFPEQVCRPGVDIDDGMSDVSIVQSLVASVDCMIEDLVEWHGLSPEVKKRLWDMRNVLFAARQRLDRGMFIIDQAHLALLHAPRGSA